MKIAACVITACPRDESLLRRTIESLAQAGWVDPLVVAEPWTEVPAGVRCLRNTHQLYAWPNHLRALAAGVGEALFERSGAILVSQDDVLYAKGLRSHLEESGAHGLTDGVLSCMATDCYKDRYPDPGVWRNIGQSTHGGGECKKCGDGTDEAPVKMSGTSGVVVWCRRCQDLLQGAYSALAYVYPVQTALELLADPQNQGPQQRFCVDPKVQRWMHSRRKEFWMRWPSMCQHIGELSSIRPEIPLTRERTASEWTESV